MSTRACSQLKHQGSCDRRGERPAQFTALEHEIENLHVSNKRILDSFPLLNQTTTAVNSALDLYFPEGRGVEIIAELGRYYVDSAFTFVVNIVAKREVPLDHPGSDGRFGQRKGQSLRGRAKSKNGLCTLQSKAWRKTFFSQHLSPCSSG